MTVDYHKTWFQPVSASALIVRDGATSATSPGTPTTSTRKDAAHPNQVDKSLQTTRRFDALKLWLTLRVMGPDQIGEYVDAVVDLTEEVARAPRRGPRRRDRRRPGPEHPGLPLPARRDVRGRRRRARRRGSGRTLYERGTAMVAATKVDGRGWLKLTLLNPLATRDDILGITDEVVAIGRELCVEAVA